MPIIRHVAVVFRVAAGPRLGFGHLVRCRSLARALGIEARVSVRGGAATRRAAAALGLHVLAGGVEVLDRERPDVVVVDDPSAAEAAPWVRGAARRGLPVATIHDGGLRVVAEADLTIDGSVVTPARERSTRRTGPRYAVLDPGLVAMRQPRRRMRRRVLVAVGGGAHVFSLVPPLVADLARRVPSADIHVAAGFTARRRPVLAAGQWLAPERLAAALADADVAIVAGGLTAYEACALGVPAVAVSVVAAQQPTVAALARRGAAIDGGSLAARDAGARVGAAAARLLMTPAERRRLTIAGRRLVDGRGAIRVAAAVRDLAARGGRRG